jgi:RNA-directed DNA polymerase
VSGSTDKPFSISKRLVWEAYQRVAANMGAAGVDGQSLDDFGADLEGNLYKIWNRMSSGSYFPSPVLAVEIPKPHDAGTRVFGAPTVADRAAQTVVAMQLDARAESIVHDDSYGYRPNRSALDAVAGCRRRCQKKDWVIDLDVAGFFDSVDHDLLVKAVDVRPTLTRKGWCCMSNGG